MKIVKSTKYFLLAIVGLLMTGMTALSYAEFTTVNCVTDEADLGISQAQCEGLEALWDSTDGPNWTDNTNWDTKTNVGTWAGVTHANGGVAEIDLSYNNLTGSLPAEIEKIFTLQSLELNNNQISGGIPAEVGNFFSLKVLNLGFNQFSGSIPVEIGNLSNLEELGLYSNQLTGNVPSEIGNLSNLLVLTLHFNQLSGNLPSEIGNLFSLSSMVLSHNQFSGSIPTEIGNLLNIRRLILSNNQFTGNIPTELGMLTNLDALEISNNQLTGNIPAEFSNLINLEELELNNNQLTGDIPDLTGLGDLMEFSIDSNYFTFSNLEANHFDYDALDDYDYSPQNEVDLTRTISVTEGFSLTITPRLAANPSGQDIYQWLKDNIDTGASERIFSKTASMSDAGVYRYKVTNNIVDNLTLESKAITLVVLAPGTDTDGDGIADEFDVDDDNDGFLDVDEIDAGSNPIDATSTPNGLDPIVTDAISTGGGATGFGFLSGLLGLLVLRRNRKSDLAILLTLFTRFRSSHVTIN